MIMRHVYSETCGVRQRRCGAIFFQCSETSASRLDQIQAEATWCMKIKSIERWKLFYSNTPGYTLIMIRFPQSAGSIVVRRPFIYKPYRQ